MNSWIIALHLIKRTIGSKKGFLLTILLPTVIISTLISMVGMGSGSNQEAIAYVDLDQSEYSTYMIRQLEAHPSFKLIEFEAEDIARNKVIDQEVAAAFIIPVGYGEQFTSGIPEQPPLPITQLRLALNAATFSLEQSLNDISTTIANTKAVVEVSTGAMNEEQIVAMLTQLEKQQVSGVTFELEGQESRGFLANSINGFMLMFLMIIVNQSLTTILEDRRNQTMARVYAAPVRSGHIAIGNFLGSFLLGTIQVLLILLISRFVFRFDFGLPLWSQFIILECFILAALGIAIAVGGIVRNPDQLSLINNLVMTPTCMLGGCFWPVDFMPDYMQKIANFVPQRWALEAITRLTEGGNLLEVTLHIVILLIFAIVLLAIGSAVLRPTEATHTAKVSAGSK